MFLCFLRNTAFRHSKKGCGSLFCDAEGVVFSFAFYTRMRTRKPDGFSVGPFSTEKAFFIYQLPGACLRKGRCSQVRKSRILAVLLTILLCAQLCAACSSSNKDSDEINIETPFVPVYSAGSYGEFLQLQSRTLDDVDFTLYKDNKNYNVGKYGFYPIKTEQGDNANPITNIKSSGDLDDNSVGKFKDDDGVERVAVHTSEEGFVEWTISVPSAGLYTLGIDYMADKSKAGILEYSIYVNGELQYTESRSAALDRTYVDKYAFELEENGGKLTDLSQRFEPKSEYYYDIDSEGNESRGVQEQRQVWTDNSTFHDSNGSYTVPLKFYLKSGENVVRISSVRGVSYISDIYFYTIPSNNRYTDYLYEKQGSEVNSADVSDWTSSKLQAEYPTSKSDPMLFSTFDRASAFTEPPASTNIKLNIIGGERWETVGQWIEYTVNDIPKSGLYKIAIRYRQNLSAGIFTSREITVNTGAEGTKGENFDEYIVQFPYGGNWEVTTPTDSSGDASLFWFEEGTNKIRLKAVTGELNDLINACDGIVRSLQSDYTKITAITGGEPDTFQDYDLAETIPEVISDLKSQGDMLNQIYEKLLSALNGEEGQYTAQIKQIVNELYVMYDDPESITTSGGLRNLNSAITSLGDFVESCSLQPIEIDYIEVLPADAELPAAEGDAGKSILHQFKMFFASFFQDLNSISGEGHPEYEEEVEIWTTLSRDYAILTRQIIDRGFVNQYGINLTYKLFPGELSSSMLAGLICSAQTGVGPGTVQDYAARHSMYPINTFKTRDKDIYKTDTKTGEKTYLKTITVPGFKDIKERYDDSFWNGVTVEMYREYGNVDAGTANLIYGVPEVLSFSLLYYREDIFDKYNLTIPNVWDDYYTYIPTLQKYNMQAEAPQAGVMIYQYGGLMYKYDNSRQANARASNIDSDLYLKLFDKQNAFYTEYKCPITMDGHSRFRTGEVPMIIGTLSTWKNLYAQAPEIRGLWKFHILPGVEQEDGTVNREQIPTVTYSAIYAAGANHDGAWEFIQWFNDYECSNEFGREVEALIGQVERYASAVKEAFKMAPWTSDELKVLMATWDTLRPAEVCFGDYYSGRYIGFAQTEVIVDGTGDGHATILEHMQEINKSITQKREELNLPE